MQTGDDILFTAPGPDFGTIPTATTEIVGTPGNSLNVYWIVTHFPIGSVLSGPFPQKGSPNVLDDENYILISWLAAPGASTYDLLVTKDLVLPKQPGQFWLAGGLTETEFRDTGQGLAFYDIGGIPLGAPQEEHIYFNNRDFKQPTLQFIPWPIQVSSIIFEDGSEQNTAGGGAAAAPPNRAIQFNDNGSFGGSQILTWDGSTVGVGIPGFNFTQISQAGLTTTNSSGGSLFLLLTPATPSGVLLDAANFLAFRVPPGSEAMRIDSAGFVGIGTQNPQYILDINGVATGPQNAIARVKGFGSGGSTVLVESDTGGFSAVLLNSGSHVDCSVFQLDDNKLRLYGLASVALGPLLADEPRGFPIRYPVHLMVSQAGLPIPSVGWQSSDAAIGMNLLNANELVFGVTVDGIGWMQFRFGNDPNPAFLINPSGGYVGINTTNPIWNLDVTGAINSNTSSPGANGYNINSVTFAYMDTYPNIQLVNIDLLSASSLQAKNLPSADPGAGTKLLWYDPTDGNIVKFSP